MTKSAFSILKSWLSGSDAQYEQPRAVYALLVAQARQPVFYQDLDVPDTLDGRFDLVALHVFLVAHRLKAAGAEAEAFSKALIEVFVDDMDRSLREMGVGDLSVGRKVKQMMAGFYGRARAYEEALESGGASLEETIARNLYGTSATTPENLQSVAEYVRGQVATLSELALDRIFAADFGFSKPIPPVANSR